MEVAVAHYFENQEGLDSKPKQIEFRVATNVFKLWTDFGMFSHQHLDIGTQVLLKALLERGALATFIENYYSTIYENGTVVSPKYLRALDLGSAYGGICIPCACSFKNLQFTAVEVNTRAYELCIKNSKIYNLDIEVFNEDFIQSSRFDSIEKFDLIISNPPVRIGKDALYKFLDRAYHCLNEQGSLFLVIGKKQGAKSLFRHLQKTYDSNVACIYKESTFYVLHLKRLFN